MGRQRRWLVVAVVLFALGAALMFWGTGDTLPADVPEVEFPRELRSAEHERLSARRTHALPVLAPEPGQPAAPEPQRQDPGTPNRIMA